tara:strand:+ start:206 stop:430 length:225 start_codon:yes stop_codon:yes gene_type:complete
LKKILEDFGVVPENTNFGVKASAVKSLMEENQISFKSTNVEIFVKTIPKSSSNGWNCIFILLDDYCAVRTNANY